MKNAPFLLSTVLSLVAVVLSIVSFRALQNNGTEQAGLLKMQDEIQVLNVKVNSQNTEANQNAQQFQNAQAIVERANTVLQRAGYLAAKNKNEKLTTLLTRHKFEKAIPTPEDLKKIEDANAKQGQPAANAPANNKEAPPLRSGAPAAPNP